MPSYQDISRHTSNVAGIMPNYEKGIFADVDETTPHYADIKWMKEQGIAKGYSDGTYRPNAALTRADAAAFLHRLAEELK